MDTKLLYQSVAQVEADAIAVILFEDEPAPADLKFASAWLDEMKSSGEFLGKTGDLAVLHQPHGIKAKRLVAVGGGKKAQFDSAALRKAAGSTVRTLKQKGVKSLSWLLEGRDAEAAVEGAMIGNFEPDQHKTTSDAKSLEAFHLVAAANGAEIERSFERGKILGDAQNFTRELVTADGRI